MPNSRIARTGWFTPSGRLERSYFSSLLVLMTLHRIRLFILLPIGLWLTGCHRAPDGRKVFLQSEGALDKVRGFRMHLDGIGGREATDAEFACDKDVSHWITLDKPESQKVEYVQTSETLFVRFVEPQLGAWRARKQDFPQGVCNRVKFPAEQTSGDDRRLTVDQQRSMPPFFAYANESGAQITNRGTEPVADVLCEVWEVKDSMRQPSYMREHTIWIGVEDRLPRKYVEGNRENPDATVTYSDYNQQIAIEVPSIDSAQ
jgi:hypothetical protein